MIVPLNFIKPQLILILYNFPSKIKHKFYLQEAEKFSFIKFTDLKEWTFYDLHLTLKGFKGNSRFSDKCIKNKVSDVTYFVHKRDSPPTLVTKTETNISHLEPEN